MPKRPTKSKHPVTPKHPAASKHPGKSKSSKKPKVVDLATILTEMLPKKPLPRIKETVRTPYAPRPNEIVMSATHFKAHCLEVMDQVKATHKEVVITKRNTPVAKLVPVPAEKRSLAGFMQGTVEILGDIVSPDFESWDER